MIKVKPKVDYDEYGDVLYVTFGAGEPSYCEEIDDLILLERGMFTNALTGLRIIGLREKIEQKVGKNKC